MDNVRDNLFEQLLRMYRMPAFCQLAEFLQGETAVMIYLAENVDGANPSELSDHIHLSRPRVAQIMTRLNQKKWVTLKRIDDDRRRTLVKPTEIGLKNIVEKRAGVEQYFDLLIAVLGNKRAEELGDMISEIVDKMETTQIMEVTK